MTFLSIIIPFDRPARYLKDCLDSLSEQEMEDTEVILIINGNEEDISDLLKDYDGKLNLILKQFDERIGVGKARNEGLNLATGKYVYFIDSDDYRTCALTQNVAGRIHDGNFFSIGVKNRSVVFQYTQPTVFGRDPF